MCVGGRGVQLWPVLSAVVLDGIIMELTGPQHSLARWVISIPFDVQVGPGGLVAVGATVPRKPSLLSDAMMDVALQLTKVRYEVRYFP